MQIKLQIKEWDATDDDNEKTIVTMDGSSRFSEFCSSRCKRHKLVGCTPRVTIPNVNLLEANVINMVAGAAFPAGSTIELDGEHASQLDRFLMSTFDIDVN